MTQIENVNSHQPDPLEKVLAQAERDSCVERLRQAQCCDPVIDSLIGEAKAEIDRLKLSDTLTKTIIYLYKTDLSESVRTKMIRDLLKGSLKNFCENHEILRIVKVGTGESEETK